MTEDIWVFMIGNSDKDNDEILEAFTLQMVKGEEMDTDLNKSWKMKGGGGGGGELQPSTVSVCQVHTISKAPPPPPPPGSTGDWQGSSTHHSAVPHPVQTVRFYKL